MANPALVAGVLVFGLAAYVVYFGKAPNGISFPGDAVLADAPNFEWAEFFVTSTGLDNTPDTAEHAANVALMAVELAQPLRDHYGAPMRITSGYRNAAVNAAVGGVDDSRHKRGLAIDYTIGAYPGQAAFNHALSILDELPVHKLIYYAKKGHVHASMADLNAGEVPQRRAGINYEDGRSVQWVR